jgi:hypothetical protein
MAAARMAARTAAPERRAGPRAPTLRVATTAAPTTAMGRPAAQVRWAARGLARLAIQSNANTPVGRANSASDRAGKSGNSGSTGASGTGDTDVPAMGASKEMKRQSGEPQKAP